MTEETMPPAEEIEPVAEVDEEEADASGEDGDNTPAEAPDEIDAVETEDDGEDDG